MQELIKDFLKQKKIAVAGSFRNETKFAYKIFKALRSKGYEVYPVNPGLDQVDGVKCYKSIKDIPFDIDAVNLVVPPKVSQEMIKDSLERSIKKIWLQPGAEDEAVLEFCQDNNIKPIHGLCIMLEAL